MTPFQGTDRRVLGGYLSALSAGFCYGLSSIIARKIVSDFSSPIVATAFSLTFGAVILGVLFHRQIITDLARAPMRSWLLLALSGASATWGVSFLFLALSQAPVVQVAPMIGTAPLVAIVLTHTFLKRIEQVSWRTMLGGVLVVGGITLLVLGRS